MYSPLPRRIKAFLIDGLLIGLTLYATIYLVSQSGLNESWIGTVIVFSIVFSVEPLMIALTGATFGQHLYGLRVRRQGADENLNILLSYLRYIIKIPLGILSLVTVLSSKHHQGVHDMVSRSIVVHKNPDRVPRRERLNERIQNTDEYEYPSTLRRLTVIVVYLFLSFVILTVVLFASVSDNCINYNRCTNSEEVIEMVLSIVFYIWIFIAVGMGWQCRLVGCRRKLKNA